MYKRPTNQNSGKTDTKKRHAFSENHKSYPKSPQSSIQPDPKPAGPAQLSVKPALPVSPASQSTNRHFHPAARGGKQAKKKRQRV